MPDSLLNVQQVADYLQLNLSTVYQWAQQSRLPAIKLGGRWRFRRADLDTWLEAQTRRPGIRDQEAGGRDQVAPTPKGMA
jgi:excisionase family DNA binding protein